MAILYSGMRSTLTIEDDLAGLLKQRSKELGKSFKEVVMSFCGLKCTTNLRVKIHHSKMPIL